MIVNGIIETSSGDLLRAGVSSFVAGAGESLRADVPFPFKVKGQKGETQMHRWNGVSWVLVAQIPIVDENRIRKLVTLNRTDTEDENALVYEEDFDVRENDRLLVYRTLITAGSFAIRFSTDGGDRATLTNGVPDALVDITDLAPGKHKLQLFARTAGVGTNIITYRNVYISK